MALDDEYVDPEPVCIYGIDEDIALDKFMDTVGKSSRNKSICYAYRVADIAVPAAFVAGTYITVYMAEGNPNLLPWTTAVLFSMVAFVYRGIVKLNQNTAEWFAQEAERQEKSLKGLNN